MAAIGIDLGGTKIQGVRLDGTEVDGEVRVPTPRGGVDAVVSAIAECVAELGGDEPVGIGVPGAVDSDVVLRAPNLDGFEQPVPLGALVAEAIGQPVVLDNDVNAAAVAEHRLGAAKGAEHVLAVFVGTGVGGALLLGGALHRGATGAAGELGHVIVERRGRTCGCGGSGHVESYAGRASMEREARRRAEGGTSTALFELAGGDRVKSGTFAKALEAGDPVVTELLDDAVVALGAGIASVVSLVDVELVVVGGGLADKLGPGFVGRIEQATRARLFLSSSPVRVVPAALGDHGGAMGAALLAG